MKKIILSVTTALMMVVLCMAMTACSSVEGTYKFDSMKVTAAGQTVEVKAGEEYDGKTLNADFAVLTMNKDNTFTMKSEMTGSSMEQKGTWEEKDGKYLLTMGEGVAKMTLEATLDGNKLVVKISQFGTEMEITLKK